MLTSPHQHEVLSPPLLLFPLSCWCPFPALTASLPRGGAALSSQRSQWSALLRPCWRERKTSPPQLMPSIFFALQHSSLFISIISLTTSVAFPLHVIQDFTLSHHGIPPTPMVLSLHLAAGHAATTRNVPGAPNVKSVPTALILSQPPCPLLIPWFLNDTLR